MVVLLDAENKTIAYSFLFTKHTVICRALLRCFIELFYLHERRQRVGQGQLPPIPFPLPPSILISHLEILECPSCESGAHIR